MSDPRLLDLFCCAGGAARGYQRAGFYVIGVDIAPQPHYAGDEFHHADALAVLDILLAGGVWNGYTLGDFAVIHASPPCQDYARTRYITHPMGRHNGVVHPRLIAPVRERLERTGLMWVIENVANAYPSMPDAIMLCGTSLGLHVERHRLFSSNVLLCAAGPCHHQAGNVSVRRKHADYIGIFTGATYTCADGRTRKRPKNAPKAVCEAAMGVNWMTMEELGEAIPPAYTEWLGHQLMQIVRYVA